MYKKSNYRGKVRKKKKRVNGKAIGIALLIILIVAGVVVGGTTIVKNMAEYKYQDKESFEKFVHKEFKAIGKENELSNTVEPKEKIDYKETVSQGINQPEIGNRLADQYIEAAMDAINHRVDIFEKREFGKGELEKAAFVTGYDTFKGEATESIVLTTESFTQNKGEALKKTGEKNVTFNFTADNKLPVTANMVFTADYQKELSKYLEKVLTNEYSDQLSSGFSSQAISPESGNLNNFVITKNGAKFFFDSNVITEGPDGLSIEVSKEQLPGIFRDEIKIRDIDPEKPMVALTFDDGPDPKHTGKIVDILNKYDGAATFYLLGHNVENMKDSQALLNKMVESGHEIGSHSYDHPNLFTLTDKQIKEQNDKTDKVISKITGEKPVTYRPPFGNGDEKTTKIFNKAGVLWSIDTEDWKYKDAKHIENSIKKAGNLNGQVILMHSIYDFSEKATENIVPWLVKEGYQLVTVSELLQYKYDVNPLELKFYGYGYFGPLNK